MDWQGKQNHDSLHSKRNNVQSPLIGNTSLFLCQASAYCRMEQNPIRASKKHTREQFPEPTSQVVSVLSNPKSALRCTLYNLHLIPYTSNFFMCGTSFLFLAPWVEVSLFLRKQIVFPIDSCMELVFFFLGVCLRFWSSAKEQIFNLIILHREAVENLQQHFLFLQFTERKRSIPAHICTQIMKQQVKTLWMRKTKPKFEHYFHNTRQKQTTKKQVKTTVQKHRKKSGSLSIWIHLDFRRTDFFRI